MPQYNEEARSNGWNFPWLGWGSGVLKNSTQGFITDCGVFLDRKEAAKSAHSCGQIKKEKHSLFSEDLW